MHFTLGVSVLAGLSFASAIAPNAQFERRDPSDKSGNTQIAFKCEGETIPNPGGSEGAGEGGSGYFTSSLGMTVDGGDTIYPAGCTSKDSTCDNCIFDDSHLSSPTNVTACWNPPGGQAGCSVEFSYNGYDYDSQNSQPKCGHTNSWGPFTDTIVAICYFDY